MRAVPSQVVLRREHLGQEHPEPQIPALVAQEGHEVLEHDGPAAPELLGVLEQVEGVGALRAHRLPAEAGRVVAAPPRDGEVIERDLEIRHRALDHAQGEIAVPRHEQAGADVPGRLAGADKAGKVVADYSLVVDRCGHVHLLQ